MLMFHKDAKQPVDVHPSQIENMRAKGWTDQAPKKKSSKKSKSTDK